MTWWILFPPGFHYFKNPKRFVILCSNLKFSVTQPPLFFWHNNRIYQVNKLSYQNQFFEHYFKKPVECPIPFTKCTYLSIPLRSPCTHLLKVLNLDKPLAILNTVLTFGAGSSKASSLLIWAPRDSIMNHGWMDLIHVERILTISSR